MKNENWQLISIPPGWLFIGKVAEETPEHIVFAPAVWIEKIGGGANAIELSQGKRDGSRTTTTVPSLEVSNGGWTFKIASVPADDLVNKKALDALNRAK
jgi:hypothetical protein